MARIIIASASNGRQLEVEQAQFDDGFFPGYVYVSDAPAASTTEPTAEETRVAGFVSAGGSGPLPVALRAAYVAGQAFSVARSPGPVKRLVTDGDMLVKNGSGSAATVWRTDRARQILVVGNATGDTLNVAEGTLDSDAIPGSGYVAVPPGSEYVTTSVLPVFAYFTTTAGYARVYTEIGS